MEPLKKSVQREVDEELAFHVEMRVRELVARGMSPDAARADALRRFGDLAMVMTVCRRIGEGRDRDMRRAEYLDELSQDLRYALRQLRRTPAFTLIAALTLALGIGATTTIFSAVHAVVLRPLPFHESERLVRVRPTREDVPDDSRSATSGSFLAWRDQARSFERMAAAEFRNITIVEGDRPPQQAAGARVTADFFPMLGVAPALGRVFTAQDDQPGSNRVAVLSYELWRSHFNRDPGMVGRTVRLNSEDHVIIGVMPASFSVLRDGTALWLPIAFTPEQRTEERTGYLDVIARLRPGVTLAQARQEMTVVAARHAEQIPDAEGVRVGASVVSFQEDVVGSYRQRLFILLGAVGFVLLIACGNVANLLLARGAGRRREIAIRGALGAGRGRVVRQLLTESVMLGLMGGVAGVLLAWMGASLLTAAAPENVPRLEQTRIDLVVVAFAFGITLASSLVFGLVPAFRSANADLQTSLREGGRGTGGATRDRVRQGLVVLEVALSLVLLVGAGLLIRSAILLERVEPGFDPRNMFTAWMSLPPAEYQDAPKVVRTYERVVEEVRGVPGIESAALISVLPMIGVQARGNFAIREGDADQRAGLEANVRIASPGFFSTMRIPLRAGRDFTDRDVAGAPCALIINEAAARTAWPNEPAVGQRMPGIGNAQGERPSCEIVGVVGDVRDDGLREPLRAALYWPAAQTPPVLWNAMQRSMFIVARTTGSPLGVTRTVQEAVMRVDRTVPVFSVRSMEQLMARSLAGARFNTLLLTVLGAIGLMLAAVGIYGVIAYFVSQRRQEIGVRMALGATPRRVLTLVVGQGIRPVLIGIALGSAASIAVTRVLASQLYGITATDPLTFIGVALVLALIALAASAIPARRATRVDPREALSA
jgi:predicted permease